MIGRVKQVRAAAVAGEQQSGARPVGDAGDHDTKVFVRRRCVAHVKLHGLADTHGVLLRAAAAKEYRSGARMLRARIRPDGGVMSVSNPQAAEEEKAVTASHKESSKSNKNKNR